MNKKLRKTLERQSQLTAKMMEGTITDDEKSELKKLNISIQKSTKPHVLKRKTTLKTIKLSDFQAYVEDVMKSDEPNADDLALAKRNITAVKGQDVTDPEGIVAIEVFVKEDPVDAIKRLEQRIAELEAKADNAPSDDDNNTESSGDDGDNVDTGADQGDDGDDSGDNEPQEGEPASKEEMAAPTALALALEALDSIINKITMLKVKFESNDITLDEVYKAWPDWEVKELVEGAASILAKIDSYKTLIEELTPKVNKLKNPDSSADADNTDGADSSDGSGDDSVYKTFLSGADMAPSSEGGAADHKMIKTQGKKDIKPGSFYNK